MGRQDTSHLFISCSPFPHLEDVSLWEMSTRMRQEGVGTGFGCLATAKSWSDLLVSGKAKEPQSRLSQYTSLPGLGEERWFPTVLLHWPHLRGSPLLRVPWSGQVRPSWGTSLGNGWRRGREGQGGIRSVTEIRGGV